jgi:V/A-type H+-transporting ATPase subunit E
MRTETVKIEHFRADIMNDVAARKHIIETEANQKLEKEYNRKELEFLEEAYNIIQEGLKKIDREKTEVISKTQMENKVKLLNKRKEIIDSVFQKAKVRIKEYTKTEEYVTDLIAKIKEHMKFIGEGEYTIYINYNDKDLYKRIQDNFKDCKVFIERKYVDMLGGCKLLNTTTNIYLDDSIAKMLEEEEDDFLQYCKIEIEDEVGD